MDIYAARPMRSSADVRAKAARLPCGCGVGPDEFQHRRMVMTSAMNRRDDQREAAMSVRGRVLAAGAMACAAMMTAVAPGQVCVNTLRTLDVTNNPPGQSSTANSIAAIGNRGAIQVNSSAGGIAWDGQQGGSSRLLASPIGFLSPTWFLGTYNSKFYYTTSTRLYQCGLDGSNPTVLFGDNSAGQAITILPSESFQLAPLGGQLVFAGVSNGEAPELAITDGTSAGTRIVLDIAPGTRSSSSPQRFVSMGSKVFFFAQTDLAGLEPWITDGTPGGTMMLADIHVGTGSSAASNPDQSTVDTAVLIGTQVYFLAAPLGSSASLAIFKTDGTPGGTMPVDLGGVVPRGYLAPITGGLLFVGNTAATGDELYFTDGNVGGTRLVSDLTPGTAGSVFSFIRSRGDRAFVGASINGGATRTLFATDGTAGNAVALPSVLAGGVNPAILRAGPIVRGKFVYAAVAAPNSRLGVTDGTPAGTCAQPGSFTTFFEYVNGRGLVHGATNSRAFVMGIDVASGNEPRVIDLCPADFNNSGGDPNVQDVYDYLGAFFAGQASGDFNGSGGAATVQDVLDFVAAWFRGCP
jgi:ELWxxDGT repeat protein